VLFIGTQFSILYTSMYSPAEAATCIVPKLLMLDAKCDKAANAQCLNICMCVVSSWFSMFNVVSDHAFRCVHSCAV
jgi:hypothetical protein